MITVLLTALLPIAIVVFGLVTADLLILLWLCDWSMPAMIRWLIAAAHEQNEMRSH